MKQSKSQRRSIVLVTGANSDMLEEALRSEADVICLDFEDTVADKAAAHALLPRLMDGSFKGEVAIRINPLSEAEGLRDLLFLQSLPNAPRLVKMTKVSDPYEVKLAAQMLPDTEFIVIIETAQALENVAAIAAASPAVYGLVVGGKDLSSSLGASRSWSGLLYARGRIAAAAAAAGVAAEDEPYRPLDDLQGLEETCVKIREMGFTGKTTVDLRHVPIINRVLSTS
ncbi:aldolase/citrate lyase family protein [Bordetella sp. 2513F-2]